MQEQSAEKSSIPDRLKKLRVRTQLNWAEIGKLLGMSESMLYQVIRGDRNLSDKAMWRLEHAEVGSGLTYATSEDLDLTDERIRNWIVSQYAGLDSPEIGLLLTAVIRVANQELLKFVNDRNHITEADPAAKPEAFTVVMPDSDGGAPYLMQKTIVPPQAPRPKSKGSAVTKKK